MLDKIYNNGDIDIIYDTVEDLYSLGILYGEDSSMDYTKQELVAILKDMIKVLGDL